MISKSKLTGLVKGLVFLLLEWPALLLVWYLVKGDRLKNHTRISARNQVGVILVITPVVMVIAYLCLILALL